MNAQTTECGDGKLQSLHFTDRSSGESRQVDGPAMFVQIGLLPNTEWLKASWNRRGEIEIDDRGHTNVPGVFAAAGDATTGAVQTDCRRHGRRGFDRGSCPVSDPGIRRRPRRPDGLER